ncbi:MAG: MotE family protein [Thermincolia bacterium]
MKIDVRKWMIRISLLVVPILVLGGTVYLLNWLGVIEVNRYAAKVPLVNKWVYEDKVDAKKEVVKLDPLVAENKKLQEKIKQMETKVKETETKIADATTKNKKDKELLERQKQELEQNLKVLEDDVKAAQEAKAETEIKAAGYDKLALYYAQMKPKNAAAIMDKLDNQTVIGVLDRMESEQAAKILSLMDPERAAKLAKLISS